MVSIVMATGNSHKVAELKTLLAMPQVRWHSLADFPGLPLVEESADTFEDNAIKKAYTVARLTGRLALADDSGLEVDALGGRPGVRSARFSGRHGNDSANNDTLLRRLQGISPAQRRARYRCVLALASPDGLIGLAKGAWEGRIALEAAGNRGFGYDPIFVIPRFGKTVGQLPRAVKQRLSHRARAALRMRQILKRVVRQETQRQTSSVQRSAWSVEFIS